MEEYENKEEKMKTDSVMQGFYKNTKIGVTKVGMDELNELTIMVTKTSETNRRRRSR